METPPYEDLNQKGNEKLIRLLSTQCQHRTGDIGGATETTIREIIKAILDNRHAEKLQSLTESQIKALNKLDFY